MAAMTRMALVLVLGATAVAWSASAAEPVASSALADDSEELLYTSFEEDFPPPLWRFSHPLPGAADVDWGRSAARASSGMFSIYCAGAGPAAPGEGGPAPANTASWAIVGPFDLSETAAGLLTFDLWLRTEPFRDVFMWLVSTDGRTYSGSARSTSTDGWRTISADLANWGAAGSVIGEPEVWIAFVYQSDQDNLFEGAYVDEVRLVVDLGSIGDEGRTYTSNADFNEGSMVGVQSASDRLVLTADWDALPYLWMPNSFTGTVSKVDVESGAELGRYRTGPTAETDPGVAVVDLEGACWVGNRGAGTVVKIGLVEIGGCPDLNGDGDIRTSSDRNGDGDISGSELLAWGDDECVLVEVALVEGSEGAHVPGEVHGDYQANDLQAVAVDANGDVWAGVFDSRQLYRLNGTSGEILDQFDLEDDATSPTSLVVDGNGTVWVSSWPDRWVLGVDPTTGQKLRIDLDHGSRGLALGGGGRLFVTGANDQLFSRIDTNTGEVTWRQPAGWLANGVATTENGRVWIAAPGDGTVTGYRPTGELISWVSLPGRPNGLAVDQDGKIWVAGSETETIYRINPTGFSLELGKTLVGSVGHDATGDFTGVVPRNLTSRYGTWTVVHDGQRPGTPWGRLSWQAQTPAGTSVGVRVRSSEDNDLWSAWEVATNGADLASTPPGRYLQIQVSLQAVIGDNLPKLDELTVTPMVVAPAPEASFVWSPESPQVGETVSFQDTSTGDPTAWAWDFGDGTTSDAQSPSHAFGVAGSFDVTLTASNAAGSDSSTRAVVVGSGGGCALSCSANVPQTASLNQAVTFEAVVDAVGCNAGIAYSWSFGDGQTSDEPDPTHTYATIGTLRWELTAAADGVSCAASGDITVSGAGPAACDQTLWVPVVSRGDGANGSVWRSDLGMLGVDPAGAAVELRFHSADSTASGVVSVAPGAMVNLTDVVDWLDPGFSGSGSLEICADGEVVVDSRTYNVLAPDHGCTPSGTFGQHLAGFRSADGLAAGESARLGQLRESASFRTNIGVVNTGSEPATVAISLFEATGTELVTFEIEIAAGLWRQLNRPFYQQAGRDDLDAASARISVVSGSGIVAYASVIDNLTNDPTTVLPQ